MFQLAKLAVYKMLLLIQQSDMFAFNIEVFIFVNYISCEMLLEGYLQKFGKENNAMLMPYCKNNHDLDMLKYIVPTTLNLLRKQFIY